MLKPQNWHKYWADYKLIYGKPVSSPYPHSEGHYGPKKGIATLASRNFKTLCMIYVSQKKNTDQRGENEK